MQAETIQLKGEVQHLLDECLTIADGSLYSGQAHFEMAHELRFFSTLKTWALVTIPAVIAALAGLTLLFPLPTDIPKEIFAVITALSGFISAVSSLHATSESQACHHETVGNQLTALRHKANSIANAYWQECSREKLIQECSHMKDIYNSINGSASIPSPGAFERARKRIKAGYFTPDFKELPLSSQPFWLRWLAPVLLRYGWTLLSTTSSEEP